jgi:hypothetical protein
MTSRIVFLFVAIIFLQCKGGTKETRSTEKEAVRDSTLIFDGKSLDGWEVTNFGPQGPVYLSGEKVILGMGDGMTGINLTREFPKINYKVTLEAMRVQGNDFFCGMTFPVDEKFCTLIVGGWGGTVVGLSSINKMDASENETTTLRKFEKERWYRICLIVKPDTIKAFIDDEKVVDFAINGKELSIRPEVQLSKPFGIASWNTTAALRNIRVVRNEE